jgi:hypothetical protein
MPGGLAIFAVAAGTPQEPRAEYLPEAIPVTTPMLQEMAQAPIEVGEVFRFTKRCREESCRQWDEKAGACSLINRWVTALNVPAETPLPRCAIRRDCQAWHQIGAQACRRCHLVTSQWITGIGAEPLAKVDLEKLYL